MSDQLVIDTLDFVCNRGSLQGNIPLVGLERLRSYLADTAGELTYLISGQLDRHSRPMLKISVNGNVNLSCQRCLKKMEYGLDLETELLLARNEDELSRYDEDIFVDAIYASSELSIQLLIEDEVILGLPISPRHQNVQCHVSTKAEIHTTATKEHPFTVLASLKRTH
ncbi:DUF177 domain-containing protein [Nitrosomonas sp. HPC101]|uniref:YceD family protein n=1 Tax=Nitrosomonas sp. HPC101 TaxID=1658667 RepID=UPI00136C8F80|nr:YceD family protein [Nitrosomonas sp. HPC101]MXS84759.1 DUF177 domain-containing protein [Nitrosomonas sp. HPC101]